jgi:hypothetical protein
VVALPKEDIERYLHKINIRGWFQNIRYLTRPYIITGGGDRWWMRKHGGKGMYKAYRREGDTAEILRERLSDYLFFDKYPDGGEKAIARMYEDHKRGLFEMERQDRNAARDKKRVEEWRRLLYYGHDGVAPTEAAAADAPSTGPHTPRATAPSAAMTTPHYHVEDASVSTADTHYHETFETAPCTTVTTQFSVVTQLFADQTILAEQYKEVLDKLNRATPRK